jgi:hypothetical protein
MKHVFVGSVAFGAVGSAGAGAQLALTSSAREGFHPADEQRRRDDVVRHKRVRN